MALTLEAAVRTLFGTTLPGEAQQVGHAMSFSDALFAGPRAKADQHSARIGRRRETNARRASTISWTRWCTGSFPSARLSRARNHRNDLLSMLMGAMDEDGSQMTPKQLRDETMTLFLAGHETTALTLAWTWYLLSQNPAAETRLHEELRGVLGGRPPEVAELARLPYLHAVVNEVSAALSAGVFAGANGDRSVHDRGLRFWAGRDGADVAMGDAPRFEILRRAGCVSPGTVAGWAGRPVAARGLFSVRRWSAALHRARIRDARIGAGDWNAGAAISVSAGAGAAPSCPSRW